MRRRSGREACTSKLGLQGHHFTLQRIALAQRRNEALRESVQGLLQGVELALAVVVPELLRTEPPAAAHTTTRPSPALPPGLAVWHFQVV